MAYIDEGFAERVQKLETRNRHIPRGMALTVDSNGQTVLRKRKPAAFSPRKGILILLVVFFGWKGFLYQHLGAVTYNGRLATLAQGTLVEQAGAYGMRPDPVTLWVARQIGELGWSVGDTHSFVDTGGSQTGIWSKLQSAITSSTEGVSY
jgi:hypothetical protein